MSIATDLQNVHINLQGVLTDCNAALVGKGGAEVAALAAIASAISGLPSGGGDLPSLDNPAAEADVLEGKEFIDQSGEKKTGTMLTPLPSWIKEMQVQTFTPEADTNEELTFSLDMENVPNLILILADHTEREKTRDFIGLNVCHMAMSEQTKYYSGYLYYANTTSTIEMMASSQEDATNPTSTTWQGVGSVTNKSFVVRTAYYGGQYCYWRAGHTYTIIALKV